MTLLDFPRARPQTRTIGIVSLLEWAFVVECVRIHDDAADGDEWNHRRRHGTEWVIYERGALLGTAIDGGKGYIPDRIHDDAETVAMTIEATLHPIDARMLRDAAKGSPPDPMLGAVPACVQARDLFTGKPMKPELATRQTWPDGWGDDLWEWRGYRRVRFFSRVCQITYDPTHHQIAQARRAYGEWWFALDAVRRALDGKLRDHRLTDDMPAREPWK